MPVRCDAHAAYLPPAQRAIHARCIHPGAPFTEFADTDAEVSIVDRFETMVARHGPRVAVCSGRSRLTYRELDALANRVARAVRDRAPVAVPVAVLLANDAALSGAVLGVLKAGGFYMVLDPSLPPARIADMLHGAAAGLLVTYADHATLAAQVADGMPTIDLAPLAVGDDPGSPGGAIAPERPAYVVYTSGSTGTPKGILYTHRMVMHGIREYTNTHHLCAEDRLSQLIHPSGNGSVWHLFGSVLNGASLFPYDPRREGLGRLTPWLSEHGITVLSAGASLFREFIGTLDGTTRFPALRLVRVGSEPIFRRDVEGFQRHLAPDAVLSVGLSISETGRVSQYFIDGTTILASAMVPAGYAVPGTELLVLDDEGCVSASAREGEIAVRSAFLSPGYWRRPDLTAGAFQPDFRGGGARIYRTGDVGAIDADGCLVLRGRQDEQIKIRGYRIEPLEIEFALGEVAGVHEAAVVAWDSGGGSRLVAYVRPSARPGPSVTALRAHVAARLPAWMVPAVIVIVDSLPRTRTGKIDRRALPTPPRERPELEAPYLEPQSPVEVLVAGLWADVLGLERVGVRDRFSEIGGDSLAAGRLVSRVRQILGVEAPTLALLEASTVAEMALVVTAALVAQQESDRPDPDGGTPGPNA